MTDLVEAALQDIFDDLEEISHRLDFIQDKLAEDEG